MPQTLATIAISCFNHEEYIAASIESAVRQTWSALEILVFDDGSSDDSVNIIESLPFRENFTFIPQQNAGYAATLNRAIERASGKYFTYWGSDDIAMLDRVEKQVALMEARPEVAVCAGNALMIDGDGILIDKRLRLHPARDLQFHDLLTGSTPGFVSPTAMIRTDVLREIGGYRPDIPLEDLYLWLKLAKEGHQIHVLNDILLYYRKHESNTYRDLPFMYHNILKTLAEYSDSPEYDAVISKLRNSYFLTAAKRGQKQFARELLKEIPTSDFNLKVIRGCLRLLLPG